MQLRRLRRLGIKIEKYVAQKGIDCRLLVVCYETKILNSKRVKANKIVQFIHCDFKHLKGKPIWHKRVQEYYACSNLARDSFIELTGLPCETMYNPIDVDKVKPILKLISPTRLAKDKGRMFERMETFAKQLQKYKIPFIWYIYSNEEKPTDIKEFAFMKQQLDISSYIYDCDYLVQFSDSEGYAYTINESLTLGVPVLVTSFDVVDELGIKNGKNGYIIPFDVFEDEEYDFEEESEEDLTGWTVRTPSGDVVGTVTDYEDIPGNTCLWVQRPTGDEVLLPLHEDLVIGLDPSTTTLTLTIPDGLL